MAYIVPKTYQPCKGEQDDLPNGLKQLSTISEILISRDVNPFEVLLPCNPRQSKFSVFSNTESGEEILQIKESGMCLFRECIGAARDLNLRVNNADDETVASFFRPIACSRGCCLSPGPPYIAVNSPPNVRLGTVQERITCCNPVFDALPINEKEPLLTYSTDRCYLKSCDWFHDIEIDINDPHTGESVAKILKKSKSDGGELFSLKNDFIVQYTPDLDIVKRLMVIASCILFNFNNFEYDRRFCC